MPTDDRPKIWRSSETEMRWILDVYDAIFSILRIVFRTQLLVGYFILHSELQWSRPSPLTSVRSWGRWFEFCDAPSTKKSSLKIFSDLTGSPKIPPTTSTTHQTIVSAREFFCFSTNSGKIRITKSIFWQILVLTINQAILSGNARLVDNWSLACQSSFNLSQLSDFLGS